MSDIAADHRKKSWGKHNKSCSTGVVGKGGSAGGIAAAAFFVHAGMKIQR